MEYRRLGRTGLKVSEISLGSWLTYGNSTEKDTAAAVIDKAYELGINSFDTANVYVTGEAEKIVGEALAKYPRESYVLATKVFWPMGEGPNDRGLSRKHVFEQLHASLKRLQMDYVDIYYCHRYDPETPIDETLRTIDDMVRQGKVLYVGVSEWTAAQIVEGLGVSDRYLLDRIVVNQPQYHMFNRYIETDIIPTSEKNGISQIVFSPLAQGVLTGKYKRGQSLPAGSRATDPSSNMYMNPYLQEDVLMKVEKLEGLAKELDLSLSQLALAWILRHPSVASALVGASKPQQIEENVKASGVKLSEETVSKIESILQV
ncbi:voltage-dependent potassium channel beta subunit [Bacillus mesophilus]|uniref:Aldo/keto reductase n=1 Tax=Bacillus mesophilus TaxID=1808955 RepID=A0A6M0QBS4_9BACI|nr:aldo/keto reductase family protein [Bacillus mesophilus]MBM7660132.1 voltage-dependent potassium channel beta subunit [Bacillus mesophilus]NEY73785.1 aldo/keto reductase [Bacillus mesophilus]